MAESACIADTVPMSDTWFVRYGGPGTTLPNTVTTQWEFGLDGLTEEQALEIDRRIKAAVREVAPEQFDGTGG